MRYATLAEPAMTQGSFLELLRTNIWYGQLYGNFYQIEHGRLFQIFALFMFGMLLGRKNYFVKNEVSGRFWKKMLIIGAVCFIPFFILRTSIGALTDNESMQVPLNIIFPSLANFSFMVVLVSGFVLLWFKSGGYKFQRMIIPYGRMTLTNYIGQSIIGITIFYGFGLGLYRYTGATYCLLIGIGIFMLQLFFSRWWLGKYKQGPLETIWSRATWLGKKR